MLFRRYFTTFFKSRRNIEHLACLKMCSKGFENLLTSKMVQVKNYLNRDFSVQKSHEREIKI